MRNVLIAAILMFAGICYGGGSEVPWPSKAQEAVIIEDLSGVWMSKNQSEPETFYHVYFQEVSFLSFCPYLVGIDEVDARSGHVRRRGSSVYCLRQPRQVSFVMFDEHGEASNIITMVGVKKENSGKNNLGSQDMGMTVMTYSDAPERVLQELLYKHSL